MDEIVTDGMAPVLPGVFRWIALVEEVPATLPKAEPVGIVQPVLRVDVELKHLLLLYANGRTIVVVKAIVIRDNGVEAIVAALKVYHHQGPAVPVAIRCHRTPHFIL